jgi:hemerythrin-like domain-containing protein
MDSGFRSRRKGSHMGDNMSQTDKDRPANLDRRGFLKSVGIGGTALLGAGARPRNRFDSAVRQRAGNEPGVMSPNEDLMQEHALLNRVLLIYEEAVRRLEARKDLDPDILKRSAQIIQHFIEQYHERLEEDYVFPRFERAGKLLDLVPVLREQHKAGRVLTGTIISSSTAQVFADPAGRKKLTDSLSSFIRMYRPHESREGSVLFPAFRNLIPAGEFQELGEMFEKKEHELLGPEGFEGQVQTVAGLEQQLGIYAISQFTPK